MGAAVDIAHLGLIVGDEGDARQFLHLRQEVLHRPSAHHLGILAGAEGVDQEHPAEDTVGQLVGADGIAQGFQDARDDIGEVWHRHIVDVGVGIGDNKGCYGLLLVDVAHDVQVTA